MYPSPLRLQAPSEFSYLPMALQKEAEQRYFFSSYPPSSLAIYFLENFWSITHSRQEFSSSSFSIQYHCYITVTLLIISTLNRNPSISNILRWVAGTMGQMNRRPSIWCSKYFFFHDFLQNSLQKYFQSICLSFLKKYKNKSKEFWVP